MRSETSAAVRLADAIDAFTRFFGKAIAWLILPMVLSLVWEVVARYFFDAPTVWAYDMTFMLYGTFFMVGSAWTLQRGGHIRTDVYYMKWSKRTQARVDLVCYVLFFFPAVAAFAWLSSAYFWKSFEQNEHIVTSPWMPIVYPFKFVIPLATALLLIQGLAQFIRAVHAGMTGARLDAATRAPGEAV